ncbi:MAG: ComEC/Rec2 family competence protein [Prevotella sp.]|nr:ComEC/Rec2 family competence protein [Prevotella sp.]
MTSNRAFFASAPLLLPAAALAVGVVVGDRWTEQQAWWILLALSLLATFVLRRQPRLELAAILWFVFSIGGLRSSTVRLAHDRVAWPEGTLHYEAVVASEVVEKPKTVAMDVVMTDGGRRLKCYIAKDENSLRLTIGDRLRLRSRVECNSDWRFGAFDYRRYLEIHGFSGRAYVWSRHWQPVGRSWQGLRLLERVRLHFLCYRHQLLQCYRQQGASGSQYAVLAAMTLGDKSAMTQELKEVYAVSGASHVLALSGLHLGIIYILLSMLVVNRRFRGVSQVLIVLSIWAFALLVGLPSSVVRAAVMISTYALLSVAGRNHMSLNALALAALVILIANPDSLFDVGFQLSFAAMLAILLVQPVLEGLVSRSWLLDHPVLRWAWGLTTASVAAQAGVAPLIAYYFGRFSTYFLLTNFVVIPVTTVILYLALAALLLPVLSGLLLMVVGGLNTVLTFIATHLPHASIEGLHPSVLQTVMVYVVIVSVYLIVIRIIRYDEYF